MHTAQGRRSERDKFHEIFSVLRNLVLREPPFSCCVLVVLGRVLLVACCSFASTWVFKLLP